jgi:aminoglycoside/choline kinase family phosphotransferase
VSDRTLELQHWLVEVLGSFPADMRPASTDASSRRYWRLGPPGATRIAVDAPPQHEDAARFVRLAGAFRRVGLNTPEVLAADVDRGFLLLSDLGERSYLSTLTVDTADRLYGDAIGALITLQAAEPLGELPDYDGPFLLRELVLFDQWLLQGLLSIELTSDQRDAMDQAFSHLVASALDQPRVCVHRDFHSRNLMLTEQGNPGVLDFQDAVVGPVTYDLVSLLKDCYIRWDRARIEDWARGWLDQALDAGILGSEHEPNVMAWMDLMGAQRHLKAAGIFARLALRDGRPGYLADVPRTLGYVTEIAAFYPALAPLGELIETVVMPRFAERGYVVGS